MGRFPFVPLEPRVAFAALSRSAQARQRAIPRTPTHASVTPNWVGFVEGTAALGAQADATAISGPEREILAAIQLVARGVALRVSVSGFDLPVDLAQEAVRMAETAGCFATIRIGEGGRLSLVIMRPDAILG